MIEDQVLFHLTKFGNSSQSLLSFPPRLKGRDEAVPQGSRFASLNPVLTRRDIDWSVSYVFSFHQNACKLKAQEVTDMHMISGISVLAIHHLDGEPLGVGAAVGVGPRGVGMFRFASLGQDCPFPQL